jgi:hypothetical protein
MSTSTGMNSAIPKRKKPNAKLWTPVHDQAHKSLYKKWMAEYPDSTDILDNYIYNNKRQLDTFINNLPLSFSSKKGFNFMIVRWLEINKPHDRYIVYFQQSGYNKGLQIDTEEQQGLQTEREIESYRPLTFLEDVLRLEEEEFDGSIEYLLLACITLQPTLRGSFYANLKIIFQKAHNDGVSNFILINRGTKAVNYIVNKDKVSNGLDYKNGKNSVILLEDKELSKLIVNSVREKPRQFLFEQENGVSYSYESLLRMLRVITNIPGISFNMFRSAHVNDLYNKPGAILAKKIKLASQMRHSLAAALKYYHKPGLMEENEEPEEDLDMVRTKLRRAQDKETYKNTQPSDKAFARSKKDILRKLNGRRKRDGTPSMATQPSIDKYNLILDAETGIWS